jgi:hypothetical protein
VTASDSLTEAEVLSQCSPGELRKLDKLIPEMRRRAVGTMARMLARGHKVGVGSTLREIEEQQAALARGTTSSGQILTWHFLGRAVDFRRRLADGSLDQTTGGDETFWRDLFECAGEEGLRSLAYDVGRPVWKKKLIGKKKTWDAGHVEDRGGYATLVAATKTERPDLMYLVA